MQSVDRFLTTHTGSLPRPDDLIEMVIATQRGNDVDPAALEDRITSAVFESTRRQVEAGVDIVNDGEMSKPSYATYGCNGSPASAAPPTASRSPT
jgi:5-methyltetrahydropteroyltriglutamate--homocysteine methyltransferase